MSPNNEELIAEAILLTIESMLKEAKKELSIWEKEDKLKTQTELETKEQKEAEDVVSDSESVAEVSQAGENTEVETPIEALPTDEKPKKE